MSRRASAVLTLGMTVALWPAVALAGMPTPHLSDLAQMRIETISFFLAGLLLAALAIRWLWNFLCRDFPRLPRLSYGKALAVVVLWGLMFVVVLTMISGARELLTPGAWEKQGLLYKLEEPSASGPAAAKQAEGPASDAETLDARREGLQRLKAALWEFALKNDGRFPPAPDDPQVAGDHWQVPDTPGMRYLYVAGLGREDGPSILAYEPQIFGDSRLVLTADGRIVAMANDAIRQALAQEETP